MIKKPLIVISISLFLVGCDIIVISFPSIPSSLSYSSIILSSTTSQSSSTLNTGSSITPSSSTSAYFYPVDIAYDGLRIDPQYLDDDLAYNLIQGTYWGTGGTFLVEYDPPNGKGYCGDGDTTGFAFPADIANKIESTPKRVRYFNLDTPETSGTPEKWGLLAKDYTCSMLSAAEEVYIQTDPGDKLLDRYGRLLGWVWIKRPGDASLQLLNYWIVRQGLAEVKYLFGAGETQATVYQNDTYTEWMFLAEARAEANRYGMHSSLLDPYHQ